MTDDNEDLSDAEDAIGIQSDTDNQPTELDNPYGKQPVVEPEGE